MKVKPVLDDWEIPRIATIATSEQRSFVELSVPGRASNLLQDLNTAPTRIVITGSLFGDESRDDFLDRLRGKFKAGQPVTFVADIVTATEVKYVVVETLDFQQNGTAPDQIDYVIGLTESPPPPPPPDPLGGLDTSLLDQAAGFVDTVTGAIDALAMLGSLPDIGDPTKNLKGGLDGVKAATSGVSDVGTKLGALFNG